MSIFSLEQTRKHNYVDLLFGFFALTLVLLILVPPGRNIYSPIRTASQSIDNIHISAPIHESNQSISFAADRKYWKANCSQGWSADSQCDTIVVRAQSCSISVASAYCSQYEKHLQENNNK